MSRRRRRSIVALACAIMLSLAGGLTTAVARDPRGSDRNVIATTKIDGPPATMTLPPVVAVAPNPPLPPAPATPARPRAPRKPCAPLPTPSPAYGSAGHAIGKYLLVSTAPGGPVTRRLNNPTRDHQPLVVLVHALRGDWAHIQYSERPNGVQGWVPKAALYIKAVPHRMVVSTCSKRLAVFKAGRKVLETPVATGTPRTPTPHGNYYIDFVWHTDAAHRAAYGPVMLSVAAFSTVFERFGKGGIGQIAFHGTAAQWSIGKASSNGCIRLPNATAATLGRMIEPGTPVTIVG